jgi:hypothetical protein
MRHNSPPDFMRTAPDSTAEWNNNVQLGRNRGVNRGHQGNIENTVEGVAKV